MKKFKKIFAVLLTLAMVLGMSMTSFAAAPSGEDKADITIQNIKDTAGVVIKAYRIVEPEYVTGVGLSGYKVKSPYVIADDTNFKPTAQEITTIAGQVENVTPDYVYNETTKNFIKDGENYTANVTAGEYLIIVESTNYTYNPMVVSAAYSNANNAASLGNSSVSATDNWTISGSTIFAKSSEVKTEKTASVATQEVGGTVNYTINGTIPSYSAEYTNPQYKITDAYTNLTEVSEPTVTIGGSPAEKDTDYTYTSKENGFEINFLNVGGYASKSLTERAVVISYSAKIAASASTVNPATNTATLNYSNKPGENKNATPSNTYTHTFDINGEFLKTGENNAPLAGSTFTLYKEDGTTVFNTCQTKVENGKAVVHFEDVAEGKYVLKETIATNGYSLNDTVYNVEIKDVTYDKEGNDKKVTGYTVEVKEGNTVKGTYVYTVTNGQITAAESNSPAIVIQNTKLSSLPSTGGIGTTIFTIGGCAIMIIAAALFFASRRKAAK